MKAWIPITCSYYNNRFCPAFYDRNYYPWFNYYFQVPVRRYHSPVVVRQKNPLPRTHNSPHIEKKQLNGNPKIPRIEDIEIFRESRLKIEKKKGRKKDEEAKSCSIEDKKTVVDCENMDSAVKKSHTAPCLMTE